jgi:hypothetical protein
MTTQVLAKTKSLFLTKTFGLGVLEIALGLAILLMEEVQRATEAGEPIGWGLVVKGIITIALRYFTKQPVTATGKPAKYVEAPTRTEVAEMGLPTRAPGAP